MFLKDCFIYIYIYKDLSESDSDVVVIVVAASSRGAAVVVRCLTLVHRECELVDAVEVVVVVVVDDVKVKVVALVDVVDESIGLLGVGGLLLRSADQADIGATNALLDDNTLSPSSSSLFAFLKLLLLARAFDSSSLSTAMASAPQTVDDNEIMNKIVR